MRRLRHKVSAVAVVASAAMLLAACGGGSSSSDSSSGSGSGGSLDIYIGAQPNFPDQFAAWSKDITDKFKAKTGADLTIETYASAADETTKIQSSVVAGSGPDIYNLGTTFTPVAYATQGFLTLSDDDWAKIGGRARFLPQTLGMSGPDQTNQIGIPAAMRPFGLAYNTDMFTAAGITAPPTTWDDFVADATKLTNSATGVYGTTLDYSDGFDPWKFIWAMTEQQGGYFVSPDLKTSGLGADQTLNATTGYFDLLTKYHLADPASVGWKAGDATAAFAAGKAAMQPMVTAQAIPTLDKSPLKGHYAFASLPTVALGMTERPAGAEPAASIVSGDNLAIASYTKNKDLALQFIDLFTSTDMQLANYQAFGNLPTNADAMNQLSAQNALLAPFLEIESNSTPTAFTGAWADVQNGVTNVVTQSQPSLANGSYDTGAVKTLLDTANATAQSALDRANK
jgi:multiple sugar transport system substrate-binding protein